MSEIWEVRYLVLADSPEEARRLVVGPSSTLRGTVRLFGRLLSPLGPVPPPPLCAPAEPSAPVNRIRSMDLPGGRWISAHELLEREG